LATTRAMPALSAGTGAGIGYLFVHTLKISSQRGVSSRMSPPPVMALSSTTSVSGLVQQAVLSQS
ncbi:hypothetical protein, partial [Burkholderia sp. SIMBA_048]|uniref:hypothetical protein n=1 Tax=Burkholderia sp. SIMBA_048 TaxID=3085789 RepID=UPI00397A48D3